jgi:mannan endo-1,4-beta-mannosidase
VTPAPDAAPADPAATARTRAVYAALVAAPSRPDQRMLVGQALRGWDFAAPVDQPITALTSVGLPAPAVVEVDLTDFGVTAGHDAQLRTLLAAHAAAGGLISLSWHVDSPFTHKNDDGDDVEDPVDLHQLADPADPQTPAGQRWRAALDRIAAIVGALDAVVLFRPLHESNGNWFWWGQADPAEFRAVWRGLFGYLTATKNLHNLLWVYAANRNYDGPLSDPTRLYPGDDVVDLVGLDIYDDELSDAEPGLPGYDALVGLGKPFGITEYGAQGAADGQVAHDGAVHLPNAKVIHLITARYPDTVLATAWYSSKGNNWQISDKPDPGSLLHHPWAITLPTP